MSDWRPRTKRRDASKGNPLEQHGVKHCMPSANKLRAVLAAAIIAAVIALPARAQQLDVIRGQVLGPENKPLEDAKVTATSLSGNVNRSARTERALHNHVPRRRGRLFRRSLRDRLRRPAIRGQAHRRSGDPGRRCKAPSHGGPARYSKGDGKPRSPEPQ